MASKVLKLAGEINERSSSALVEQIEGVPTGDRITIRISSPGGEIFAGTQILSALRSRTGGLTTINESLAASMASAVFAIGDERVMAKGSRLMVHRPWSSTSGESADLRKQADLLDSLEKDLVAIYVSATGLDEARIREMLESETWMTSEEAIALGFAHKLAGEMEGHIPSEYLAKFQHVPADLQHVPEPQDGLPTNVVDLQNSIKNLTAALAGRTKERDHARASLAKSKTLMEALKRSYGIGAAQVVATVPFGDGGPGILEQFALIKDDTARAVFYRENQRALMIAQEDERLKRLEREGR